MVNAIEQAVTMTPPELAKRWGVAADKVLTLIRTGQLTAINLAADPRGRPRYRIYLSEVERFEASRSTRPPPKPKRRRRQITTSGKDYF